MGGVIWQWERLVWELWDGCLPWPLDNQHIQRQTFGGRLTCLATNNSFACSGVCRRILYVPRQGIHGGILPSCGGLILGCRCYGTRPRTYSFHYTFTAVNCWFSFYVHRSPYLSHWYVPICCMVVRVLLFLVSHERTLIVMFSSSITLKPPELSS